MGVKLSVVIAALNCEDVIEQAICSFLDQQYENRELLIIDGGSSDHTPEIIQKYREQIAVYVSEKDGGIYDAYNKGSRMATGDYVVFIGSDDAFYDTGTLSTVAAGIEKNGFPDLLCTSIYYVEKGRVYIEKRTHLYGWEEGLRRKQPMVPHQGMYARRSILLEHPFAMNYEICADLEFYSWCCNSKKKIGYLDIVTAYFSRQGITARNEEKRREEERRILAAYGDTQIPDAAKCKRRSRLLHRMAADPWGITLLIRFRGFRIHKCRNRRCRWCDHNRKKVKNPAFERIRDQKKPEEVSGSLRKRFVSGVFDSTGGEFCFSHYGAEVTESGRYTLLRLSSPVQLSAGEFLERFKEKDISLAGETEGLFLAVIYDKERPSLTLMTDRNTSAFHLYYTRKDGKFYFSTDLKLLLLQSGIRRKLDPEGAAEFLENGFVTGRGTLIREIRKLTFGEALTVDKKGVNYRKYNFAVSKMAEDAAKVSYYDSIVHSIDRNCEGADVISIPLSGGYDSNVILAEAVRRHGKRVQAFSVGGKKGKDETLQAERIAAVYGIGFSKILVGEEDFQKLPDIIWRLDGSVYESGVFLQYRLARLIAEKTGGRGIVVCGECNNEIQHRRYAVQMEEVRSIREGGIRKRTFSEDPFIVTNLLVLKKSSLMMNSFGLVSTYPYKETEAVSEAVSIRDCREFFMGQAEKHLSEKVVSELKTEGGTTDVKAFISQKDLMRLSLRTISDPLIRGIWQNMHQGSRQKERWIRMRHRILSGIGIKEYWEERPMRELCLLLFSELYLSGKYDAAFAENGCDRTTAQVLADRKRKV